MFFITGVAGVDPAAETSWQAYASAMLGFNLVGAAVLLGIELTQA